MHRQPLLDLLADYSARHPDEVAMVERFQRFVHDYPDCFERRLEVGHVTGSAWLVDAAGERVLLTHHRKLDIWVQLGGHADGDADVARVALTEAQEESGLTDLVLDEPVVFDVDIHRIPERPGEPAHWHHDVRFVVRARTDERYAVSAESHDLAWVDIAAIGQLTREASMLRMARKWLARHGRDRPAARPDD